MCIYEKLKIALLVGSELVFNILSELYNVIIKLVKMVYTRSI